MPPGLRVLVGCKRVIDYAVKVRVRPDLSGVVTDGVKHSMNPFDEIALEEAIQLREKKVASDVLAFSCGTVKGQEILRNALAMGADRALHVELPEDQYLKLEPFHVAEILQKVVQEENIDLVILGKQAIDDDASQVGQMLAARLGWPQATFASHIEPNNDQLTVTREVDGGSFTVRVKLPAVVTTDLRLNQPRYITLPNIMKAKKKPMVIKKLSDFDLTLIPHLQVLKVENPAVREGGIKVDSVETLVEKLRSKGLIPN
ncbi:Electron-transfer-flavoprotein beta polypeptide [Fasciola gigantica]|uniref:Electron transfer flavoprotein subunit beta n=1 Tax=Fasciola gigantica TaxID=46835 RepID=A0A504Y7Z2_FASGI|nr:Electron-transfer-flavoprotein beta polypeptide [Fasciola gigantica]